MSFLWFLLINGSTFSSFVRSQVLFPVFLPFKHMLQQEIELLTLMHLRWVLHPGISLVSLDLKALTLILGHENAADQSWMMQEQVSGITMAVPEDTNKTFKTEMKALELTDHQWVWDDVKEEPMAKDLHFKTCSQGITDLHCMKARTLGMSETQSSP